MKEIIQKALHKNVSSFIISPFTKSEAVIVQLLFTFAFFEFIVYGGLKEFHTADQLGPSIGFLLEPFSLIALTMAIGYLLFIVMVAAGSYNPTQNIKKFIPLIYVGIVATFSLLYASDSIHTTPKHFVDYIPYVIGIVTLLTSGTRLLVIMSKLSKRYDTWGRLEDTELVNKIAPKSMGLKQYLVLVCFSTALYALIHPPYTTSLSKQLPILIQTFLQSYFYTVIFMNLYEKITNRIAMRTVQQKN